MTHNDTIREAWNKSELTKRIGAVESFAQNHGFPPYEGEIIPDWFLARTIPKEAVEEVLREIGEDEKLPITMWLGDIPISNIEPIARNSERSRFRSLVDNLLK